MARARRRIQRVGSQIRGLTEAERRQQVLDRLERVTEPVLLLLAFAMIPLLVGPLLWDLPSTEVAVFASLNLFIWLAFAADFAAKLVIAPRRRSYLRHNWLQAVVVAMPFFRPLLLVRMLLFGSRALVGMRRLVDIDFIIVLTGGLVIIGATLMYSVDGARNPNIGGFGDALWWGVVTVTTVGYGDIVPASTPGRIVAFFLMTGGIAMFGAVAGNVAALLTNLGHSRRTQKSEPASETMELSELRAMRRQMQLMQETINALVGNTRRDDE